MNKSGKRVTSFESCSSFNEVVEDGDGSMQPGRHQNRHLKDWVSSLKRHTMIRQPLLFFLENKFIFKTTSSRKAPINLFLMEFN